ncbi:MAG: hypothetical protein N2746_04645 [Deltaproteobacteria bacterium]|nr:hypothetical protein [Deltaproteobacteria bacterium]
MYYCDSDKLKLTLISITHRLKKLRNLLILRNSLFLLLFLKLTLQVILLSLISLEYPQNYTYNLLLTYYVTGSILILAIYIMGTIIYYSGRRLFSVIRPYNEGLYSHLLGIYELFISYNKNYSLELITDYAQKTNKSLMAVDESRLVFTQNTKKLLGLFTLVVLSLAFLLGLNHSDLKKAFLVKKEQPVERPGILIDLGKIKKEFFFPSYTGQDKVVRYDDKRVLEGVKGTVVKIKIENKIKADHAKIVLNNITIDMKKNESYFDGEIGLNENGLLRFDLFKKKVKYSSLEYRIRVLPDESPEIYLSGPEDILRGSSLSKADRKINLSYTAIDDYGVSKINIVVSFSDGKEKSFKIKEIIPPQKEVNGEYLWDYSELSRYVNNELLFALEAVDNDTISGPKKSRTKFYKIIIPSSAQNFKEDVATLKNLKKEMLHHLALNLTSKDIKRYIPERSEKGVQGKTLIKIEEFITNRNKTDHVSRELTRIIQEIKYFSNLVTSALKQISIKDTEKFPPHITSYIDDETRMLEKNILALQDIIEEMAYFTLSLLSNELTELRNELKNLLKKYDETKDEELRINIMALLDLLERRIKDYREIQAELSTSFSDVNINKEALKNVSRNIDEIYKSLGELKEDLMQDEMAEFRRKFDSFDNMIDDIQDDLSNMLDRLSGERYSELMDVLKNMASDIERITDEERKISSALSRFESDLKKKYYDTIKDILNDRIAKIIAQIEKLDLDITKNAYLIKKESKNMKEYETSVEAQSILKQMPELLKNHLIFEALVEAERVVSKMEWLRNVSSMFGEEKTYKKIVETFYKDAVEIRDNIQDIINNSKQTLSSKERKMLEQLISLQKKNQKDIESVLEKSKKLSSEFGSNFEKLNNDIIDAKFNMDMSLLSMKKGDIPLARSNVDESISKLDDALKEISKIHSRRSKIIAQNEIEGDFGERRRLKKAEVELPKREDFKPKEKLRDEIFKALKDEEIRGYEEFIRQYYEEIIK